MSRGRAARGRLSQRALPAVSDASSGTRRRVRRDRSRRRELHRAAAARRQHDIAVRPRTTAVPPAARAMLGRPPLGADRDDVLSARPRRLRRARVRWSVQLHPRRTAAAGTAGPSTTPCPISPRLGRVPGLVGAADRRLGTQLAAVLRNWSDRRRRPTCCAPIRRAASSTGAENKTVRETSTEPSRVWRGAGGPSPRPLSARRAERLPAPGAPRRLRARLALTPTLSRRSEGSGLALAELEAGAGAALTVLLALFLARVARQVAGLLERAAVTRDRS